MNKLILLPLLFLAGCSSQANYTYQHTGAWTAFVNQRPNIAEVFHAGSLQDVTRLAVNSCHGRACIITFDRDDERVGTLITPTLR